MVMGLLCALGWAETYVNGTVVDPRTLVGVTLERATVRFDAMGNVHVDAPGYRVQVVPPGTTGARSPTIAPPASAVAAGRWWLVTEDKGSAGHTVEVYINGQLAQTCRSGEGARASDLAQWLRPGANQVLVKSVSNTPSGGTFTVYVGSGNTAKGYFEMPSPQVEFGLAASRSGPYQREYTVNVDR